MRNFFLLVLLVFQVAVCYAQSQATVVPGKLIVKFKPGAYEQAVQAQPAMRTQGVTAAKTLSVGLAGVDKLNEQHRAVSMYRLFPYAGKHEPMQQQFELHLWYAVVIDENLDPRNVAEKYVGDSDIEWAEPMPVIRHTGQPLMPGSAPLTSMITPAAAFPSDVFYNNQWHYHNAGQTGGTPGMDIGLPQAWNVTKGNPEVIVGVVDSGVDTEHEDLKDNLWVNAGEIPGNGKDDDNNGYVDDVHGFNFVEKYFNPARPPYTSGTIIASEHGTHVAGTIAAATNNGKGVAGIAGGNNGSGGARLMACQIMTDEESSGYITAAIAYAANNGAVILQNSWSIDEDNRAVREAIKYFIAAAGHTVNELEGNPIALRPGTPMNGGIAIFAAGNDDTSAKTYPAAYDEVLAVAATNHYGRRAYYSNYGDWVDISAPGGDMQEKGEGGVASTYPGNQYVYMQGTSMACPHVSGVAALVLSLFGSETYTPEMLRDRLLLTATPLSGEPKYNAGNMGAGQVNAFEAMADIVRVAGVDVRPSGNIRMVKGDTLTLHADIRPTDAYNKTVAWSTSASKYVTVAGGLLTAKAPGVATITVRTDDGNFTAAIRVEVYEAEHAPQGFSPNGDGINDYFVLTLNSRDSYALTVFDRSGQVHYRAANYQNDWDGTANTGAQSGKKLLPGTYYYRLTGKSAGSAKTGYVVIKY